LKNEISEISEKYSRNPNEIKLIAVSKTFPSSDIFECFEKGQRDFGENWAQELREKSSELNLEGLMWHFIGSIQTNKLKYIVPCSYMIHSVCRVQEILEIDKRAFSLGKIQNILIEVNVSGEESKSGISLNEAHSFIEHALKYPNIKVCGLMTMAPNTSETECISSVFSSLRKLRDNLSLKYPDIKELSMGMSSDYSLAIENGSTMLRIGSKIFGSRIYT
jgi:hypothetical protein